MPLSEVMKLSLVSLISVVFSAVMSLEESNPAAKQEQKATNEEIICPN